MTPFGWPQLVLYCTTKDNDGDEVVKAYGTVHIPIEPGTHVKKVRMFTTMSKEGLSGFLGLAKDEKSFFIDQPEVIAKAEGREISRVRAAGKVTVTLNVNLRNMERHG
eukprot:CAMPEP_0202959542 /NCGR_PEP_ID=MMETSP1396-20130829/3719_1 /ASSEMBLY_ACC=CAM_ASM_000872 /TAXON_ID= /ORGANISM="Pseudokeronopsis sp., Strain Brazil" /LENGTH=107 /DNA_ID=CAMNT_0049678139 /DNA_START=393 /DNA_END=712 /DNA_ORIENTATION=-